MSMMIKITQLSEEIKDQFNMRWEKLSSRDQRAALALLLVAVSLMIYLLVILPLSHWSHHAKASASLGYEDFLYIQKKLPLAKQLEDQKLSVRSSDPVGLVSSSGRQAGIVFSRVQPIRQGVSVWIDEVSYRRLLTWLLQLQASTLNVKQVRLEKTTSEGFVKAFLSLGR